MAAPISATNASILIWKSDMLSRYDWWCYRCQREMRDYTKRGILALGGQHRCADDLAPVDPPGD